MTEKEFQLEQNYCITICCTDEVLRVRKMPRRAQRRIDAEKHLAAKFRSLHNAKMLERFAC